MKRDLYADLAVCDAATPGPWRTHDAGLGKGHVYTSIEGVLNMVAEDARIEDAVFIAEAREGWPEAIRRATAAERENERLERTVKGLKIDKRNLYMIADERYARSCHYLAEIERLRESLLEIIEISKTDGIAHELDQCYIIAKGALRK